MAEKQLVAGRWGEQILCPYEVLKAETLTGWRSSCPGQGSWFAHVTAALGGRQGECAEVPLEGCPNHAAAQP